ncbi:MAG: hypothetical protein HKL90_06895 [Elusimicrobia bacterium]|nr:hypothetical protein [Elusimicrobiota bacterium]
MKPAAKSTLLVAQCALARPSTGGCAWCGTSLPPGRRAWCGKVCADEFWKNHWWTLARRAAKRRDRRRCVRCGAAPPPRPSARNFPTRDAHRAALRAWRGRRRDERLEVNHILPCRGTHGTLSCRHHLDNLETLCVACHRRHTSALPRGPHK